MSLVQSDHIWKELSDGKEMSKSVHFESLSNLILSLIKDRLATGYPCVVHKNSDWAKAVPSCTSSILDLAHIGDIAFDETHIPVSPCRS